MKDADFLKLIVDICSDYLSVSERFNICKRLNKLIDNTVRKAQYQAVEALIYLAVGDNEKASEIFEKIISICKNMKMMKLSLLSCI